MTKYPATHLLQKQSSFKEALHSWSRGKDWKKGMHYEKCIVKNSTLIGFSFIQVAVDAFSNTDNLKCNITHVMEARTLNSNSNLKPLILTTKSLTGYVSRYFSLGTEDKYSPELQVVALQMPNISIFFSRHSGRLPKPFWNGLYYLEMMLPFSHLLLRLSLVKNTDTFLAFQ